MSEGRTPSGDEDPTVVSEAESATEPDAQSRAVERQHVELLLQREQALPADVEEHMREAQVRIDDASVRQRGAAMTALSSDSPAGLPLPGLVCATRDVQSALATLQPLQMNGPSAADQDIDSN